MISCRESPFQATQQPPVHLLPQADGRCWSQLVQGSRCGSLIPKDSPTESAESLCRNNAVRYAQWLAS